MITWQVILKWQESLKPITTAQPLDSGCQPQLRLLQPTVSAWHREHAAAIKNMNPNAQRVASRGREEKKKGGESEMERPSGRCQCLARMKPLARANGCPDPWGRRSPGSDLAHITPSEKKKRKKPSHGIWSFTEDQTNEEMRWRRRNRRGEMLRAKSREEKSRTERREAARVFSKERPREERWEWEIRLSWNDLICSCQS